MARIKMLTSYYLLAHKRRQEWANWKWRLFAILVTIIILFYVNEYLAQNYYTTVSFVKPSGEAAAFVLSDKLFYWFASGMIFGLVVMAMIYEGEFMLALLKLARGIEGEFGREARTVGKGIADAEKMIEREVERDAKSGIELITPEWSKKIQAGLAKAKKRQRQTNSAGAAGAVGKTRRSKRI